MQANETLPNLTTAQELGLLPEEFERVKEILGRTPNALELHIFSAMWSERCSNKNAVAWLKTLPGGQSPATEKPGLVELGGDTVCSLTFQSLALPPFLFSANGIGSLFRDTLTTGARPVAALGAFRFGHVKDDRTRDLVQSVTSGLGSHANGLGIPVLQNSVFFNDGNHPSTVINILSLGILDPAKTVALGSAKPGHPVFIAGAATEKNHAGATASGNGNPETELPQMGDPFLEKCLLEATLEALEKGAVSGIQNLDVAGLSRAATKAAVQLGLGIRINLDNIPVRQPNLTGRERLLSESQGRILLVGTKGQEQRLLDVFNKWDLPCQQIGELTDDERLTCFQNNERIADLPVYALTPNKGAPAYERSYKRPAYLKKTENFNAGKIRNPNDYLQVARRIFSSNNILSKKWIDDQFDATVQANALNINRPTGAALVSPKDNTGKLLALATAGNAHYVYADPYVGAVLAVSEATRKIVCAGSEPKALAECLNFGDPGDPEVYWQFVQAIKGITDACKKLGVPVVRDCVNFQGGKAERKTTPPVKPDLAIGVLGVIEDAGQILPMGFGAEGHQIYMIGTPHNDMGSSAYLRITHGITLSPPPVFDLDEEYHIQRNLKIIHRNGLIQSAHPVGEGGLMICLLECAMVNSLGFNIETDNNFRKDAYLFGESQSRIVVTTTDENEDELVNYLNSNNVPFTKLGEVTGQKAMVDEKSFGLVAQWKERYESLFAARLDD